MYYTDDKAVKYIHVNGNITTGPCHYPRNYNIMTSPRLPLVKAQRLFLSGIRLSRKLHGPEVEVTAPPIKRALRHTGVLKSFLQKIL